MLSAEMKKYFAKIFNMTTLNIFKMPDFIYVTVDLSSLMITLPGLARCVA
jgi:hypothetical protein